MKRSTNYSMKRSTKKYLDSSQSSDSQSDPNLSSTGQDSDSDDELDFSNLLVREEVLDDEKKHKNDEEKLIGVSTRRLKKKKWVMRSIPNVSQPKAPDGSVSGACIAGSVIVLLLLLGGGFAIWYFFVRTSSTSILSTASVKTSSATTSISSASTTIAQQVTQESATSIPASSASIPTGSSDSNNDNSGVSNIFPTADACSSPPCPTSTFTQLTDLSLVTPTAMVTVGDVSAVNVQQAPTNWATAIEGDSKAPATCEDDCNTWNRWAELECLVFAIQVLQTATPSLETGVASAVSTTTGLDSPASFVSSQCECETGILDAWKTCESCLTGSSSTGNKTRIEAINQDMTKLCANTTGTDEINWAASLNGGSAPASCDSGCNTYGDLALGCEVALLGNSTSAVAAVEDTTSSVYKQCLCKDAVVEAWTTCETCLNNSTNSQIQSMNLELSTTCGITIGSTSSNATTLI